MGFRSRNRQRALGLRKYAGETKLAFAERLGKPKRRKRKDA